VSLSLALGDRAFPAEIAGVGEETAGGAAAVNATNVVEEGVLPVFSKRELDRQRQSRTRWPVARCGSKVAAPYQIYQFETVFIIHY
jgi:hypothetical protein